MNQRSIASDPLCVGLFVLTRKYPVPKQDLQDIQAALAIHGWKLSDLYETFQATCPPLIPLK